MNFSLLFKIAFRYLFSSKSINAVQVISWISIAGMTVGAFSLITILSVFNGFEDLVSQLYNSFYPDLQITYTKGKTFQQDSTFFLKLTQIDGVQKVSPVLEDNAYLEYAGQSFVGVLKGVQPDYTQVNSMDSFITEGSFTTGIGKRTGAVLGSNIAMALGINVNTSLEWLKLTVPVKGNQNTLIPSDAFRSTIIQPTGVFTVQQEFDSKFVFVDLIQLQEMSSRFNDISYYEIKLRKDAKEKNIREKILKLCGPNFKIKNRFEQREFIYRMMKIERWVVIAILTFVLLIISFNIVGSLSMLIMEKKKDATILTTMGLTFNQVKGIFLLEGFLQGITGAIIGLILGLLVCFIQIKFQILKLGQPGNTFIIQAYPVKINPLDIVLIMAIVVVISTLAAWIPASRIQNKEYSLK